MRTRLVALIAALIAVVALTLQMGRASADAAPVSPYTISGHAHPAR